MNLMEGLLLEMNRVREETKVYEGLPNNAGIFGAVMMKIDIQNAEKSIATGDVIDMIKAYSKLKEIEP